MSITDTQLATVQAAIAKIEGGAQSYTIDGVAVTRANLDSLYARERELLARQRAEAGRSNFAVGTFRRTH